MVTVCGVFQLLLLKVTPVGETVPSVMLLEDRPMLTVLPPPGLVFSLMVNVAVPPFSVVTRPEVGETVTPADASVPGHSASTFVENGLVARPPAARPLSEEEIDDASKTQSPPRPVRSSDAN